MSKRNFKKKLILTKESKKKSKVKSRTKMKVKNKKVSDATYISVVVFCLRKRNYIKASKWLKSVH